MNKDETLAVCPSKMWSGDTEYGKYALIFVSLEPVYMIPSLRIKEGIWYSQIFLLYLDIFGCGKLEF